MSIQAGYVNYNSIKDYQVWLHSSRGKDDRVESPFYHEHIRVGWYSTFLEKLNHHTDGNSITFTANGKAHFLLYTNLVFYTPEVISSNPNLKVAWTPNLLHNYVESAQLTFNDIPVQKFDTVGADIMIQLMPRPGESKREQYLRDIGNLPFLIRFGEQLPSSRLSLHCPWSFSAKVSKCIPLCLSTSTVVTMKFTLQRDPAKLIRIREERNGQPYLRALTTSDQIAIRGIENNLLGFPEVYGRYALVTPKEIAWQKKIPYRELFYDTFQDFDADGTVEHGQLSQVVFLSANPVKALFPVAQNMLALAINNHSNYTTNPYDSYSGFSAIGRYNLFYSTIKILDNLESEIFSNDEPYWTCSACPERPGYAAIVFPSSLERDEDVGIVLNAVGGKLSVTMDETRYPAIRSNTPSSYHFRVRALTTQVFRYENNMITIPKILNHDSKMFEDKWNQWNVRD